jgi:hypothetical protein
VAEGGVEVAEGAEITDREKHGDTARLSRNETETPRRLAAEDPLRRAFGSGEKNGGTAKSPSFAFLSNTA